VEGLQALRRPQFVVFISRAARGGGKVCVSLWEITGFFIARPGPQIGLSRENRIRKAANPKNQKPRADLAR
jgi:hypothetical protein